MANGYCEALLMHLESIAGQNYPGQKVTIPGFLNMMLTAPDRPTVLADANSGGHYRTARVKYLPRTTVSQVSTTDTCAVDFIPAYKETEVTVDNIAQTGVWVPDDTIRQYCEDASATVAIGQPATAMMNEHLRGVLNALNGIYQKIETVTTTSMASLFGKHKSTGTSTAVTINIEQDGTLNDLSSGLTQLLAYAEENEFCGDPIFVGALNSYMHKLSIQYRRGSLAPGEGFNPAAMASSMPFQFFGSGITGTTWGTEHVGMFAPGSVHFIERLDNVGAFAGQRGASYFTTFTDPRVQCWTPNGIGNMQFDLQVKYIDCPEDLGGSITNGYIAESSVTNARGTLLLIKKRYGIFTIPTNSYDGADVLQGGNSTLRFALTNQ